MLRSPLPAMLLLILFASSPLAATREWTGDIDCDGDFERITLSWNAKETLMLDAAGSLIARAAGVAGDESPRIADLDGDGLPDLVAGDRVLIPGFELAGAHRDYGSFLEIWNSGSTLVNVWDSEVDDLDGDGATELLGQVYYYPGSQVIGWENIGNGAFAQAWETPLQAGPSIVAIATGESDGDGAREIYAGIAGTLGDLFLWESTGDDSFVSINFPFQMGAQVRDIHAGNLDGDEHGEVIAVGSTSIDGGALMIIEHTGAVGENSYVTRYVYPTVSYLLGCEIGDADNDGNREALLNVGGWDGYPTYIRRIEYNPGSDSYEHKLFEASTTGLPISAVIGDFDGDDLNELAIGGSGEITIFESYADDTFTPVWESAFYIPGNVMAMSIGPANEFGYPTIASCSFDGQVDIIGYDGSTYVRLLTPPLNLGNALRSVDLGYFDGGDPALDLVLARSGINLVSLFEEESLSGVEWEATGGSEYRLEVAGIPFQPGDEIRYALPQGTRGASLELFDPRGRRVRDLGDVSASGTLSWDGRNDDGRPLASGVYLVRMSAERVSVSRRVVLLR